MTDFRPILLVNGILLATLALAMVIPAIVDAVAGYGEWPVFLSAALVSLFVGISLFLTNRSGPTKLTVRQAFLLTSSSWLFISAVAALPFALREPGMSYTDAFFEAVSGLTTTGATVLTGLDNQPPGLLLWRAILQWLGGIGIIVMAIAVLPMLQIGGMQIFRTEKSMDQAAAVLPRTAQLAGTVSAIYLGLTGLNVLGYWLAGMAPFDALCHAMSTIATGGFSTHDASIGHFANPTIEAVAMVFMIAGSLPFLLYFQVVRGNIGPLLSDSQVRGFMAILLAACVAVAGWHWLGSGAPLGDSIRYASFNVISMMTGTGYASFDFAGWHSFPVAVLFLVMVVGGCTGSTTGGIKIFRFQIMYAAAELQLRRLLQPHGVFTAHYNGRPVPEDVPFAVLGFFFLFAASFAALVAALSLFDLDFITSMSGAASALANVGPGLGPIIGPAGTFDPLPDGAKWLLAFAMLLGRLELFTVLVLFLPSFWRD